jgi:hypothetical protein
MEKRKVPTVPNKPKQFKGEWLVGSVPKWYGNARRFDTLEEAQVHADNVFGRWLLTVNRRAVEVPEGEK